MVDFCVYCAEPLTSDDYKVRGIMETRSGPVHSGKCAEKYAEEEERAKQWQV